MFFIYTILIHSQEVLKPIENEELVIEVKFFQTSIQTDAKVELLDSNGQISDTFEFTGPVTARKITNKKVSDKLFLY